MRTVTPMCFTTPSSSCFSGALSAPGVAEAIAKRLAARWRSCSISLAFAGTFCMALSSLWMRALSCSSQNETIEKTSEGFERSAQITTAAVFSEASLTGTSSRFASAVPPPTSHKCATSFTPGAVFDVRLAKEYSSARVGLGSPWPSAMRNFWRRVDFPQPCEPTKMALHSAFCSACFLFCCTIIFIKSFCSPSAASAAAAPVALAAGFSADEESVLFGFDELLSFFSFFSSPPSTVFRDELFRCNGGLSPSAPGSGGGGVFPFMSSSCASAIVFEWGLVFATWCAHTSAMALSLTRTSNTWFHRT
mmetsp:Transcript_40829/g.96015  ORF Transcript_40829/g.96015 Transcript_40829/m.96015 type:complete len:306 (+) Transcript_40829:835-1752(+)